VVVEWLLDRQEHRLAGGIRLIGISSRHPEHRDHRVPDCVRVVNHEPAAGGVGGVEGEAEEPLLGAGGHPAGQAQERHRQQRPILHDPDGASFLRDEQPGVAGRRRQV
jgi:hypothetical protein